jgi:AcrR family transcriptional regulator
MARVTPEKVAETRTQLLGAAQQVLIRHGFAGLSTRRVAEVAGMPMSQIQYHFGSKEGMVLALFEAMNASLLERQHAMFGNPDLPLSRQWALACDFLEDDLASGYVQVLQELIAAGWSNPPIREAVSDALDGWQRLLAMVAERAKRRFGDFGPFSAEEVAALVGALFLGVEGQILLGRGGPHVPYRPALRRIGDLIAHFEAEPARGEESCEPATPTPS